ncbi:amidohydrolase [Streptomyces paludis]|uniref:Amidohydrolase n=1 Tax=Streptomyces paludis TaxID=2282738 RepID=A0A345HKM5_9ACTN|nr:amidohydrolase [Streptomyces paludis]AXG77249.1 amidohydrolase [Streptomyces paludis]
MIETASLVSPASPVSLVDQHCHGVLRTELGLGTFETRLGAPAAGRAAAGTTLFDTQLGFAVRRWCPPLLGLAPHCPPARYLARRRELGALETARRLLRATGITTYLVDSAADEGTDERSGPEEMASLGAAGARRIVRLERLAERVADVSGGAGSFLAGLAETVHTEAATAVAFSCASGTGGSSGTGGGACESELPEPPAPGAVRGAAARWLAGRRAGGALTDPLLLRHLLWTAIATGRPLQLLPGGADPTALTGFAAATAGLGTDLVLLDPYPYHRQAARLASVFPHVYADLGPALARTGPRAAAVLAESLESAPFGKLLFSSGARGLPELQVVAVRAFTEAVDRVLGGWVAEGAWAAADATRVAGLIAGGNARRVYGLPPAGG